MFGCKLPFWALSWGISLGMPHVPEEVSMFGVIPAGLVVGFVVASGAWVIGWLFAQLLAFVRRVR